MATDPTARPPVEHRLAGLDRRTLWPGLVAIAVGVLFAVVLPAIDRGTSQDDPIRAGDVLRIGPGVTMTPAVGWNLGDGIRVSDQPRAFDAGSATALVTHGGVSVATRAGAWRSTPAALVRQVISDDRKLVGSSVFRVDGDPRTITVDGGHVGVVQGFVTAKSSGAVAGFVQGSTGTDVVITGREEELDQHAREIGQMLASIHFDQDPAR